ncbi:glycosyl transferase [Dulcicalothrix desertica PCC 7102]|uniref:Glycosyl transferase n=1 Tax=Dulcicalothrix desertica PCC 7102 TaxID=232991 RepID=A0A433UVU5_9CYAN|nr:glycosyltransferase [Dulcicalothrix desertica]RUS97994.1 glycosyl transferase [Dulcicalothrix desertica PCC 7102]TWH54483.1 GT2 family glycosyltransferase [Dulcicalothrix desertica PCC 7102]
MTEPIVTLVVVPRERFSCTQESLESIYEHTDFPFKLIYVDGNSPAKVRRYLETKAQEKNFKLIRTDYYLSPNHARNIGLSHVDTKYLVFVDNDVVVSPGWLKALVDCAEETEATVVGPLMCENKPIHQRVHFAGGESHVVIDVKGRRHLREKMYKQGHNAVELLPQLQRTETELSEFHCTLVRTDIFERIGYLDEAMLNTKEHLDFCMNVAASGGKVYFEPASLVTYVPGPPLEWTDLHFYMLRWSDAWTLASLERIREKWNLCEDGYFKTKYKKLGVRRISTIIKPFVRKVSFGQENKPLKRFLKKLDRKINRYLTDRYAARLPQRKIQLPQIVNQQAPTKELSKV